MTNHTYSNPITSDSDLIDSRDVIERLAYLNDLDSEDVGPDEIAELEALARLVADCEDEPDWEFGITLIRDSYFVEYAKELAEEIGALVSDQTWPYCCIDWEQAAAELRLDYTSVTFDGVEYWVR